VEVFHGNTADPKTVGSQLTKLKKEFALDSVVLVGDRGMLTEARIREEVEPAEGVEWISALRGPAIQKLIEQGSIDASLFDEVDLARISSPDYPGERLIVCRNPFLADRRKHKRDELLKATERKLDEIKSATVRKRNPLRGKGKIGVRLGRILNKYKVGKHFSFDIDDTSFSYQRKTEKIAEEAALDGLYVVRTSIEDEEVLSDDQVVTNYKNLSKVEWAFRCLKTVDLKVRPIYHYDERRVRAHVFICMLAYYVEWHLRNSLAGFLFEDEFKQEAQEERPSVVAASRRSRQAIAKDSTKETVAGFAVHSLRTLLRDLGTITRNYIRPCVAGAGTYTKETTPTPHQQAILKRLGLSVD
jgi:transposase